MVPKVGRYMGTLVGVCCSGLKALRAMLIRNTRPNGIRDTEYRIPNTAYRIPYGIPIIPKYIPRYLRYLVLYVIRWNPPCRLTNQCR